MFGFLSIFLLLFTNNLEVWHIYVAMAVASVGEAFQYPAYQSSVSLLVPKKHLGRANGMVQLADSLALVIAPLFAGVLLLTIDLYGIILIDFVTFIIALTTLALVRFPKVKEMSDASKEYGTPRKKNL